MRCYAIALLATLALATACAPPPEPLSIVSSPWPGYEPLYLARDLGYLKDESVRITELPSANTSFEAFSNGSADVATLTLDETLALLGKGQKLRALVVMDISHGADGLVAIPQIKNLQELKGMRLAMENIPLGAYLLTRILDISGLKPSDITIIPMPEDKHERAWHQGKIDAAITMEPYITRLVGAGAHVLFDTRQIPDEVFDLLVVRETVYQARRKELCALASQWFRTTDYINAHPEESATLMGRRVAMDARTFRAALSGVKMPTREENRRYLSGATPALLAPARRLADVMRRQRMLTGPVDPATTIDPTFADCIH